MLKNYFPHRNSWLLYLSSGLDGLADTFVNFFSGAFLAAAGLPLHFVLLFFGLEFGLRGVFHPLGLILAARYGIWKTVLSSYLLLLIFFVLIGFAETSLWIGFFSFFFHSLARGIYYPVADVLGTLIFQNDHRGKQHSLLFIFLTLFGLGGVILSTWALENNAFPILIGVIAVALGTATLLIACMDSLPGIQAVSYRDTYRYLFSSAFRENRISAFGYQLAIIGNMIALPLFIFLAVGDFSVYGIVVGAAIVVEFLAIFCFGRYIDGSGTTRMRSIASGFQSIGNLAVFAVSSPLSAFCIDAYNRICFKTLMNSMNSALDIRALKSGHPLRFMTAYEMSLCFPELFVLSFFSLIAYFFGNTVFIFIFGASIFGLYLNSRYFPRS